ncbi:MAG: hypothetical protein GTO03_00690, partial [Planctomycetales bacterium]|nr:hypothetical protein [Planctomycetales bacterium]
MFNFKQILLLAAALPSACLAGCSPPASQDSPSPPLATAQATQAAQPKIGFIDVSRVFQMTGLQDQRNAKLEELKQRQNNLEKEGQNALQKKLREFGGDLNKLTDEQKQELQQIQ